VTDAGGVRLVVRAHEAGFGTDHAWLEPRLLAELAQGPDAMAAVVAMAGDVPICAGRIEFHRCTQFASLWGGATAPAWRRRGVYRAIVAHRTRIAVERGYRYLQVDASPDSQPILSRLGFVRLSTTVPYLYGRR
jgi:GNAT superfamily N-acetyltransferase